MHSTLFTPDVMYKMYKWLAHTSQDLLTRFFQVNLSNKKLGLIFYFCLPFRQRNTTF